MTLNDSNWFVTQVKGKQELFLKYEFPRILSNMVTPDTNARILKSILTFVIGTVPFYVNWIK